MSLLGRIRGTANELIGSSSNALKVSLHDGSGNTIGSLGGAINVHDADIHNTPVNQYFHLHTGTSTTLSVDAPSQSTSLTLTSAVGFTIGDFIQISDGTEETTFPQITNIVGSVITIDRPIDKSFLIGDSVEVVTTNMKTTAGTLASPISYKVMPQSGEVWHIQRILLSLTHGSAGDLSLFGNLTSLTNGVVFRAYIGGQYGTFTLWKDNADIKDDMFDVVFDDRAGGGGIYSTSGRGSFNKIGVSVRLDGTAGDYIEILVQDDITALTTFKVKAQGHIEGI